MPASSKKKKDFQKTKHRVGKTKPKASNTTNTSFKAKSITIRQQALTTAAPSSSVQFAHYLALLKNAAESQRRDALAFLTTAVSTRPAGTPLPQPSSLILQKIQPLILDGSSNVRSQLLKLFNALSPADIASRVDDLLLYTRAGMTHLSADIRLSALDFLSWLLEVSGDDVVSCAGGWVKTLQCFMGLLGWRDTTEGKWSSAPKVSFGKSGADTKAVAKQLITLSQFLRAGLAPAQANATKHASGIDWFPLHHTDMHMIPKRSNPYGYLNLFGAPRNEETEMYEDREDRQRVFRDMFEQLILSGLEKAQKEAGEIGRASAQLKKTITNGMAGFDE